MIYAGVEYLSVLPEIRWSLVAVGLVWAVAAVGIVRAYRKAR